MLNLDILDTIKLQEKNIREERNRTQHFFFVALSRGELDQHY